MIDAARETALPPQSSPCPDSFRQPKLRLVPVEDAPTKRMWPDPVSKLFCAPGSTPRPHPVVVFGGPGTGKTSLLIDLAINHLSRPHARADSVLMLVNSKHAAEVASVAIAEGLRQVNALISQSPLVRTVHSYAFGLLHLAANASGTRTPQLISGAEQDVVIRELLAGHVLDGAEQWPEWVRGAVGTTGFARDLRDLLLRAAERGFHGEDLVDLGRSQNRPEWIAAGKLSLEYEQLMQLRASVGLDSAQSLAPALNAAELVSGALDALATDATLAEQERKRIDLLLVDDAENLDPQALELISQISQGTAMTVLTGDGDQGVYRFRGAVASNLSSSPLVEQSTTMVLAESFRLNDVHTNVAHAIAGRLPGSSLHRRSLRAKVNPRAEEFSPSSQQPACIRIVESPYAEAAAAADMLRRSHLLQGIPWSDMAVIVRSTSRYLPTLSRVFQSAGIPLSTASAELPLARQHAVRGLLQVLDAVREELSDDAALGLLVGVIGDADPGELRRLRRGLRRADAERGGELSSTALIREAISMAVLTPHLEDVFASLPGDVVEPLLKVRTVLAAARKVFDRRGTIEEVLWAAWSSTGLAQRWEKSVFEGGVIGVQADRNLDAVMALFDTAGDFVDRVGDVSLGAFVSYLREQDLPATPRLRRRLPLDAVTVVSAHSASGREWDTVAVVGVQEDVWPTSQDRGTLLGTDDLLDILDGFSDGTEVISHRALHIADERRLFYSACTRAHRSLMITAVSTEGELATEPSRFIDELSRDCEFDAAVEPIGIPQILAPNALIAQLRSVVCSSEPVEGEKGKDWQSRQADAAFALAQLAQHGFPGASPDQWWGLQEVSGQDSPYSGAASNGEETDEETDDDDHLKDNKGTLPVTQHQEFSTVHPVTLSPSKVERILGCPLGAFLESHGGQNESTQMSSELGTLVHTLAQAVSGNIPEADIDQALTEFWPRLGNSAQWYSQRQLERTREMVTNFRQWLETSRSELTEVCVESSVDVVLRSDSPDDIPVRLKGRIDRVERDALGRLVIVDIKTGKTTPSQSEAEDNPQLLTYQTALAEQEGESVGGAALLYVAKSHKKLGATSRQQSPIGDRADEWKKRIRSAAEASRGAEFCATINDACQYCPVAASCPVQTQGRQVTEL